MKILVNAMFLIAVIAVVLYVYDIITLRYPVTLDKQPILKPTIIKQLENDLLITTDGLKIKVYDYKKFFIDKFMLGPGDEIELIDLDDGYYVIKAREKHTMICGNDWINKISIPIYPVYYYKHKVVHWTSGNDIAFNNHNSGVDN